MKISLIIPTRDREAMLRTCMESVHRCTYHKKNIEVLIVADDEDPASQAYVRRIIAEFPAVDIKLLTRPHSDSLNADYYNWASSQTSSDLVWVFADDLIICAPGWDEDVQRNFDNANTRFPDRIYCISMKDNTPPPSHRLPKFPCFPMLTRQSIAILGWTLHPAPKNWGVDYINFQIFYPIGRMVEVHEKNYINHVSWHTKQVEPDPTNVRIGQIFNSTKMIPYHNTDRILAEEVPVLREKILAAITK